MKYWKSLIKRYFIFPYNSEVCSLYLPITLKPTQNSQITRSQSSYNSLTGTRPGHQKMSDHWCLLITNCSGLTWCNLHWFLLICPLLPCAPGDPGLWSGDTEHWEGTLETGGSSQLMARPGWAKVLGTSTRTHHRPLTVAVTSPLSRILSLTL